MLTWFQGVRITRWCVLSKVIMKGVILKLEEDGCLIVKEIPGVCTTASFRMWKLFTRTGPKW